MCAPFPREYTVSRGVPVFNCTRITLPKQQKTRQNLSGFLWRRKRDSFLSFAKQPWSAVFMLCKSLRAAAKNDALCRFLNALVRIPLIKYRKTKRTSKNACPFCWRRKRDSNPRGLSPKRFSRPPRYDRFDIPPRCMPGKNNTNRGQDAVFLTNTALRSRLRHKVLTRSRALSLPENTASDSQATKSSIFPMIFGKNERSCT